MKYVAYNKMYYKGKPVGQKFRSDVATTKKKLLEKVKKNNTHWNRFAGKGKYRTATVEIKRRKS